MKRRRSPWQRILGVVAGTTISIEGDEFVVTTLSRSRWTCRVPAPPTPRGRTPHIQCERSGRRSYGRQGNWSISGGPDAKRFDIVELAAATAPANSAAALRWATANRKGPSFEAMDSADGDNVYLVTVTASDGTASASQLVSITVQNTEEAGKVTLSQIEPQEGIAITARLSDNDGNITGTEWQWYRGDIAATDADSPTNGIQADELVALADATKCSLTTPNDATTVLLDRRAPRLPPTYPKHRMPVPS